MRTLVLIGLAGLATASGILDAEARGLRLYFGGLRASKPVPAASIHSIPRQVTLTPGLAVRPDLNLGARPTYVVLPSPAPSRGGGGALRGGGGCDDRQAGCRDACARRREGGCRGRAVVPVPAHRRHRGGLLPDQLRRTPGRGSKTMVSKGP